MNTTSPYRVQGIIIYDKIIPYKHSIKEKIKRFFWKREIKSRGKFASRKQKCAKCNETYYVAYSTPLSIVEGDHGFLAYYDHIQSSKECNIFPLKTKIVNGHKII